MKSILSILSLAILIVVNQSIAIEMSRFDRISDKDGLSQNTVRCMMQDNKGFMWIGTINGLNRYNGREFNVMTSLSESSRLLTDNRIRNLKEDREGYIWVKTVSNSYSCYDAGMERFIDYNPEDKDKNYSNIGFFSNGDIWLWGKNGGCCRVRHAENGLQSCFLNMKQFETNKVYFVFEDALHNTWIGTETGLFRLENDQPKEVFNESFSYIYEFNNQLFLINEEKICVLNPDRNAILKTSFFPENKPLLNTTAMLNTGVILIATREAIMSYDCDKQDFIPTENLFDGQTINNADFYTDNKGDIWVFNLSGSAWRHTKENMFEKIDLIPPKILSNIDAERYEIYHDSRDIIWITTYGNGLFAIDLNKNVTQHFTMENSELPTNHLLCLVEDKAGEIWIGTEFLGICKISVNNYPVQIIQPAENNDDYSRNNAVRMIFKDSKKRYWFGTRGGHLYAYDTTFNKIKTLKLEKGLPFTMTEDSEGNLYVGTRGYGLMKLSPSGDLPATYYQLPENRNYIGSNRIFDLVIDSENRIWAATFGGGLHCADLKDKSLTFKEINLNIKNDDQRMLRVILQDKTGVIWFGGNGGIYVFEPDELLKNNKFHHFHFESNNDSSLNNNNVKSIFEDSKGRIWVGTSGGGLNLLVRENRIEHSWFKHYTSQNGLLNEFIQAITEDNEGFIWVSTEAGNGVSKFKLETEQFENFSFFNYSKAGMFEEDAVGKAENGYLMFGNHNGVFVFDPSKIIYDTYAPQVVVTGLKINGADILPGNKKSPLNESISMTKTIQLKYNQNSFNLEFAMLNFHQPEYNQYVCFLEGYEHRWNPATRYNIAAYRNVRPGKYIFKVKGCNSYGVWTEQITELRIIISPPFWNSVWAWLLYLALLVTAGWFAFRIILKMNRLNNAVEIEKQLTDYKLRFFTNISHEFRTPLTIIRGSIENLSDMKNLPDAATKQIHQMSKGTQRLLRLIDQLLAFRKLQNKKLELKLEKTEAVSFIKDIFQHFEDIAKKKNIEYTFHSNLPQKEMLLDRSIWDKITYNLLSNAMKYTPDNGKIVTNLDFSKETMKLSISDSGHGVPQEVQNKLFERFAQFDSSVGGTGVGLHLAAELAALHKGKVEYSESQFGGACFSVLVAMDESAYSPNEIPEPEHQTVFNNVISESEMAIQQIDNKYIKYKDYGLLVIEDDDEVREFLFNQLNERFNVIQAKDGIEGLEKATKEEPQIIVCDVMMPGMDGFEVTRRLKGDFLTSHIPIILLTAHSSDEHRLEGIQAGADAYITKPFSIKYLHARIVKLIEQREKLRQKFTQSPGILDFPTFNPIEKDREFLDKMHSLIEENIENLEFSVDMFAKSIGLGRTNFFKKVKGITGHTPNEYINIIRMKKAAELLATTDLNVSEVSYKVGVNDPFYFSRCFKQQFGKPPSQFQKKPK
jgi:signal transduction histidine kinase/ligand-binding sensor domain-containing protein/DNA-binding response OmpR family regulator